ADRLDAVLVVAKDKTEKEPVRKAAIEALGQLPADGAIAALVQLLAAVPPALQPEVARALGEHARRPGKSPRGKLALEPLQAVVADGKASPGLREAAVIALSGSRPGSVWLLDQHRKGALPEALVGAAGRLLRNSPF